jgi:hypothetical protein
MNHRHVVLDPSQANRKAGPNTTAFAAEFWKNFKDSGFEVDLTFDAAEVDQTVLRVSGSVLPRSAYSSEILKHKNTSFPAAKVGTASAHRRRSGSPRWHCGSVGPSSKVPSTRICKGLAGKPRSPV